MADKIKINYDLADIETAKLSEALANFKESAGQIYEVTELHNVDAKEADEKTGLPGTEEKLSALDGMNSKSVHAARKLLNGLRQDLKAEVLQNVDTFYHNLVTSINIVRQADIDAGNAIAGSGSGGSPGPTSDPQTTHT